MNSLDVVVCPDEGWSRQRRAGWRIEKYLSEEEAYNTSSSRQQLPCHSRAWEQQRSQRWIWSFRKDDDVDGGPLRTSWFDG